MPQYFQLRLLIGLVLGAFATCILFFTHPTSEFVMSATSVSRYIPVPYILHAVSRCSEALYNSLVDLQLLPCLRLSPPITLAQFYPLRRKYCRLVSRRKLQYQMSVFVQALKLLWILPFQRRSQTPVAVRNSVRCLSAHARSTSESRRLRPNLYS